MTAAQLKLIDAYRATGRLVFIRPRKKQISLNGGRFLPVAEALRQIASFLDKEGA